MPTHDRLPVPLYYREIKSRQRMHHVGSSECVFSPEIVLSDSYATFCIVVILLVLMCTSVRPVLRVFDT